MNKQGGVSTGQATARLTPEVFRPPPMCDGCGDPVVAKDKRARYCSSRCRQRARDRRRWHDNPERRKRRLARMWEYRREVGLAPITRLCKRCGVLPTQTTRHPYCCGCRKILDAVKPDLERARIRGRHRGSTTERGYGSPHQRLKREIARVVAAGLAMCWRCGRPISSSEPWDLGHDDHDRSVYRGPEHRRCNRAAAARRRAKVTARSW
jgi:hypothetical protein